MSDQSPPPTVDADHELLLFDVLAELDALNSAGDITYGTYSRLHDVVSEIGAALDAVTAERDRLLKVQELLGKHLQAGAQDVTDMARVAAQFERERDQARTALRDALTMLDRFEFQDRGDCAALDYWSAIASGLAGAPSGDTPQPAPTEPPADLEVRPDAPTGLAPSRDPAALPEKWEAEAADFQRQADEYHAKGWHQHGNDAYWQGSVRRELAAELRAALGDTPDPTGLPVNMDDLLTEEQHEELRADLGDMARRRRAAEVASASLPVGGDTDEWALADAAISIPRDPTQRAALYAEVGLTEDEKAAVERWIATQGGDTPDPEPFEPRCKNCGTPDEPGWAHVHNGPGSCWTYPMGMPGKPLTSVPLAVRLTEELVADIERARSDPEFTARLADSTKRNARVLERLAEAEAAERPTEEPDPPLTLESWATEIITGPGGMDSFERHEMVLWRRPERVEAAIWAIRCLANPACEGSDEVLRQVVARRDMTRPAPATPEAPNGG